LVQTANVQDSAQIGVCGCEIGLKRDRAPKRGFSLHKHPSLCLQLAKIAVRDRMVRRQRDRPLETGTGFLNRVQLQQEQADAILSFGGLPGERAGVFRRLDGVITLSEGALSEGEIEPRFRHVRHRSDHLFANANGGNMITARVSCVGGGDPLSNQVWRVGH
jgi:hypothetical protein